ncbi:hypothetical protein PQR08_13440 [Caballeronia jiangsuensis]|uniref:Uncharacterized protein n=1 Tax=Caballeronia jiangsuensis TaxID=1458357 RepID=A0ABW9CMP5_9BURK
MDIGTGSKSPVELLRRRRIRTIVVMHNLMARVGAVNANQFAKWFDLSTEGWSRTTGPELISDIATQIAETQDSKKWYRIVSGAQPLSERSLSNLQRLFPDARRIFSDGPERLFEALWGDIDDLWSVCRVEVHAYEFPDPKRPADVSAFNPDDLEMFADASLSFEESLENFECSLLLYKRFGQELTINCLSEAIAFHRIHGAISRLCKVDGVGAYRCVQMCLNDQAIAMQLKKFNLHRATIDVYESISNELFNAEVRRLQTDVEYRKSVGAEDFAEYARNPESLCSADARAELLRID